jgi:hypothetical protein
MADVTIESATLANGTLTVMGSGFTRTTTIVEVDGNQVAFDLVSDVELTVADVADNASDVDITKAGMTASAAITAAPASEEPSMSDQNTGSDPIPIDVPIEPKVKAGDHIKPATMRKDVEGTVLEDLSADPDSARAPYPSGSPRDPEDIFEEQHGYRKA